MLKPNMARTHFNTDEDKILTRMLVLKDLIAAQPIHETPCELLLIQLNEMNVLCTMLQRNITELTTMVKKITDSK